MGVAGDRMGSNAIARQRWSHIPPCLFSLSDWITEDQILVGLYSHMPALFWEMSWASSTCQPLQGHLKRCCNRLCGVPRVPSIRVFISLSFTRNMWDSQGNLGRLRRPRMNPFKGAASGFWRTLQLLQLVTNHRKKEPAQGRMLGGPMRGKGRDLGKGRILGPI